MTLRHWKVKNNISIQALWHDGSKIVYLPLCTPLKHIGKKEVQLHSFFTSALDGSTRSPFRLSHFTHRKLQGDPMNRRLDQLHSQSGRCGEDRYLAGIRNPDHRVGNLLPIPITLSQLLFWNNRRCILVKSC